MNSGLRFLFLLPLTALLACGSSAPAVGGIPPTTGDYVLNVTPVAGGTATSFTGNLYISGTSVSGSFIYSNPNSPCNAQSFPVTGVINSTGDLMSLSSSAFTGSFSGNNVSISMKLPIIPYTDGTFNASGSAQIFAGSSGTNCALASSTFSARYLPSFTGQWTGILSSGSVTGTASLLVTEILPASTAAATTSAGIIPAAASLTFTGSNCTIPLTSFSGSVKGYTLSLTGSNSTNGTIFLSASSSSSPTTLSASGACTSFLSGTISQ